MLIKARRNQIIELVRNPLDLNAIGRIWMLMQITITKDWGLRTRQNGLIWHSRARRLIFHMIEFILVAQMAAINTLIIGHEAGNKFRGQHFICKAIR